VRRKLTLAIVVVSILVALGVPAAQATTTQPQTIPSGTEVIPYIFHDANSESGHASSIKLYNPPKHTSETISGPDGTDSYLWQPQLSEDGKRVLFLDYHDYSTVRQESIGFIPSDGGERVRIVTGAGIGAYDLSQDGSKVLYQTFSDSGEHLFTAPVEGNASPNEVPVPPNFSQVNDPIFNKDGTGIFFDGYDSNDPSLTAGQLYYMNLDGTGATKLTDFSSVRDPNTGFSATPAGYSPRSKELSPDGNSIVYNGFLATDGTDYRSGIYTLPVGGGTPKEVAVPSVDLPRRKGDFTSPHYNHSGSRIMYSDGTKLWSVSAANGQDRRLLVEGVLQDSGNWEIVNYPSR
jgi:Tol biopolymer transport system component